MNKMYCVMRLLKNSNLYNVLKDQNIKLYTSLDGAINHYLSKGSKFFDDRLLKFVEVITEDNVKCYHDIGDNLEIIDFTYSNDTKIISADFMSPQQIAKKVLITEKNCDIIKFLADKDDRVFEFPGTKELKRRRWYFVSNQETEEFFWTKNQDKLRGLHNSKVNVIYTTRIVSSVSHMNYYLPVSVARNWDTLSSATSRAYKDKVLGFSKSVDPVSVFVESNEFTKSLVSVDSKSSVSEENTDSCVAEELLFKLLSNPKTVVPDELGRECLEYIVKNFKLTRIEKEV
ncbi:hypothetical protein KNT64_gp035 [Pseudomonas phage PspYZU05]|uniref:Uncharacterized protein n=1 Tax=Pseudomonas phage PspYZU05 TaxID=1983556 RepID=A0A2U7NMY2_9CAUD|nr:hypothetical protein KNT64_gp035 [Pseudomonas phage PspYZU05]ASD51987.1 hypothetical protein PspYZU05_35 [Pseudomonas phage PspYZU05]